MRICIHTHIYVHIHIHRSLTPPASGRRMAALRGDRYPALRVFYAMLG